MLDLYTMGERIRQAREDMGYTRETFSEMANIILIAMVFTGLCPHMSSLFQKH